MSSSLPKTLNDASTAWWLRATAAFLVFTLLFPSYAAAQAAVTGSTLLQSPPFTPIDPPANVMLMLDDSGSMRDHRLPMPPDVTLTTSTDPRLCNVAVPGYTTVESCGNTKLLLDSSNRYWVQEGSDTPVPLIYIAEHVYVGRFGSQWHTLAAEKVNGQNRILWRDVTTPPRGHLHIWNVSSSWTWISSETSDGSAPTAATTQAWERDFWYDHNGDGKFGDSPVEWFNRVTVSGYGGDEAGTWAIRSFAVSRNDDWILRSPALNPLWYNPAVWYKPWNNNNQTGSGAFPNASIGGAVPGTHYGAVSSRPSNNQLTQRDMRRVPTGTNSYASITTLAGTGALGTWNGYPNPAESEIGRLVTGSVSNTQVYFRYLGLPFEHGATSIANDQSTVSNEQPLDLFMRPIRRAIPNSIIWRQATSCTDATLRNFASKPETRRCWNRRASCTDPTQLTIATSGSDAGPSALSCWAQRNCANTEYTFTDNTGSASKPADLSCWQSSCNAPGFGIGTGASPSACPAHRRRDCDVNSGYITGTAASTPSYCYLSCENGWIQTDNNPGSRVSLSCWRRLSACDQSGLGSPSYSYFSTDPGSAYCYKTCSSFDTGGTWTSSSTNPGTLATCYKRGATTCAQTVSATYSETAGALTTLWCRESCAEGRPWETLSTAPSASERCWKRERTDCDNAAPLWTTTSPGLLQCTGELNNSYTPVSQEYPATEYGVTSFSRSVTTLTTVQTDINRNVTVLTPVAAAPLSATSFSRSAFAWPGGSAPSGLPPPVGVFIPSLQTTQEPSQFALAGTSVEGPHVDRLTPARYYYWNGTTANGGKGNPANYVLVQIDRTRPTIGADELTRYVIRDAATGALVSSPRCAAGSWCTWEEEAQNFANWYTYYRNRMFSAIAVMAESMSSMREDKFQNLRIGYGRINYFSGASNPWNSASTVGTTLDSIDGVANPGALIRGVRPFIVGSLERQQFFDWLFSLAWAGATPNREAIDAAGRYFTRTDNKGPWGATPGTENTLAHIPCRRNFAMLATDGEWTNSGQPLISSTGPLTGSGTPTASDSVNGPTMTSGIDAAVFTYQPTNYPQFTGGSSQDRTLTDVTVYYWNRDLRPDLANVIKPIVAQGRSNEAFWQSMSTYIVGYGLFASMDTAATRSAIAAGTSVNWPAVEGVATADPYNSANAANRVNDSFRAALASRGQFYTATSTQTLADAVRSTFDELVIQTGAAGGVALPGAVVQESDLFFRPSYFLGQNTYGKLEAFKVSDMASLALNPDSVRPQWNASLPATRTILTSTAATTATTFATNNLTDTQKTQLGGGNGSSAEDVVNYLSGSNSKEIANGGTFRNRISPFGTFVNSKPLYSKAPDFGYATLANIGASYKTFVDNNKTSRTAAVYIGGNAGMFHAFRADTGVELFAYVPRGVYENLNSLTVPGIAHRYFVDGPVVQGDAYLGGAWRNIVVGTTGAGGASVFALDVSNPTAMDSSKVLFDVTKADSTHLGNVLGTGVVGRIKTGDNTYEWVYVVGNGVESTSNQAALLVIGLEGSNKGVVRAIPVGSTWDNTEPKRNGMGGINVVFGAQRNIIAVFGGDKLGNLWRFNFSEGVPTQASGFGNSNAPLFTAQDASNNPQPITTAPVIYPYANDQWYLVFGTGKFYDYSDLTDTQAQTLYGLIYKPSETSTILKSELNAVTVSDGGTFSATPSDTNKRGWYLNLQAAEKVIANPTIANALIRIPTYQPRSSTNVCLGGGSSRLFTINVLSASASVESMAATVATPSPHYKPKNYGTTASQPTRQQVQNSLKGKAPSSASSQCKLTTVGVDKTVVGSGQSTACPQTPVLRVWRQLAR